MKKNKYRLVLTDMCNFKCPCCYNEGNVTKNKNVSLDSDKTVLYLKKISNSIEKIVLTGGEPLLYKDFNYIVEEIFKMNVPIQLTTNGYYLNKLIENNNILSKIEQINVSIDDLNPLEFRIGYKSEKNIYERVINNLIMLSKTNNRPKIYINCVVQESNIEIENIKKMIDFINEYDIDGIKYIPLIKKEENKIIEVLKKNIEIVVNVGLDYKQSERLIDYYKYNNKDIMILHQYCNNDCSICKKDSFIRINSDGNIYECLFDKKKYKNIYEVIDNER